MYLLAESKSSLTQTRADLTFPNRMAAETGVGDRWHPEADAFGRTRLKKTKRSLSLNENERQDSEFDFRTRIRVFKNGNVVLTAVRFNEKAI